MRIGLLSAANSIHTVRIANGLVMLGHEVTVFSLPDQRDSDNALDSKATLIYLKYCGKKGYFLNKFVLKKLIVSHNIEVLNAHFASGYGTLASLAGFRPFVLSVWGNDVYEFPEKSIIHRWLIKRNLLKADALLSTSNIMAGRTKRYVPGKSISITPFGVDVDAFSPSEIQNGEKNRINIGIVKGIAPKYGIKELIYAFKKLTGLKLKQELSLSIYGDGIQKKDMVRLTEELGLSGKVRFYGKIPHSRVPEALHTIDIFCAPSISNSESFGVAVVEAMACGIPCVTSDADGFTEVMEDGVTGYIVPKKDIGALAEKLALLAADGGLREKMGRAGRERVQKYYDWSKNIKTIADALTAQRR